MRNESVCVAVAGCGYWGPNLVRNLAQTEGARVKAVCDPDTDRLAHMRELYPGIGTESRFKAILADPDIEAVVIATPLPLHYDMARAALEAGKHCLVEKPLASTKQECANLCALAAAKGLVLMVGHTFLYSSPIRKIKEIIASGEIGTVRYISMRRLNLGLFQKDFNVMWDLAPHDLSIMGYLLDEFPDRVNCQGKANLTKGIEDVANATFRFPDGCYASLHVSWLDPCKVREMAIVGSRKMIVYDDLQPLQKVRIHDMRVERPPHYDSFADFQYSYHWGDVVVPYIRQKEPLGEECRHFIHCITHNETPLSDGISGMRVVAALEAASASLQADGATVPITEE